ncbi:hypothetical protein PIB30_082732 [Stylosanthes scabra]|uniref:Uncharacterized protein n=1 Tax=Stylosanthes scabra TaxID=79078 RepID=A0ABU6VS91_9FABA|nr:hypothetical protein [Stylosanthes scabra]
MPPHSNQIRAASIFITLAASIFLNPHSPHKAASASPRHSRLRSLLTTPSQCPSPLLVRRRPCLRLVAAPSLDLVAGEPALWSFATWKSSEIWRSRLPILSSTSHPPPSTFSDAISGSVNNNKVWGSRGVGMELVEANHGDLKTD